MLLYTIYILQKLFDKFNNSLNNYRLYNNLVNYKNYLYVH